MGDIALLPGELGEYVADLGLSNDDLATDDGLQTAMLLSLATDRLANEDDALPANDGDRRGWWGDQFAVVDGDRFGSRLWLLDRTTFRDDLARDAKLYAEEALQWLRDDAVLENFEVTPVVEQGSLYLDIVMYRPDGSSAAFRYNHVWEGQANAV